MAVAHRAMSFAGKSKSAQSEFQNAGTEQEDSANNEALHQQDLNMWPLWRRLLKPKVIAYLSATLNLRY